jgi:hypothetical protein
MTPESKADGPAPDAATLSHCNECGQETRHDQLLQIERKRTDENHSDGPYVIGTLWNVLQCCGCQEVTLYRLRWYSNGMNERDDEGMYFPPRVSRHSPDWARRLDLPEEYRGLLDETYLALHTDCRRLAMMGARALIDAFITKNAGDRGNFKQGLAALVEEQFLVDKQREILETAVEVGNASAHRGHNPNSDTVETVMDIVENLIHNECLRALKDDLASQIPARKNRQ